MRVGLTLVNVVDADLPLTVSRSCARVRYSVDRQGLPGRNDTERVDQKIMGDLASDAVQAYIKEAFDLRCLSYDEIRTDAFRLRDPGWDLAVGPTASRWPAEGRDDPRRPPSEFVTLSVKSSRYPERFPNLYSVISKLDFKILAYGSSILDDLHADLELQAYYETDVSGLPSTARLPAGWERAAEGNLEVASQIADALGVERRFKIPIVVGIVPYFRLVSYSERLSPGDRKYPMSVRGSRKPFWKAPLRLRHDLDELPDLIEAITSRVTSERPRPVIQ